MTLVGVSCIRENSDWPGSYYRSKTLPDSALPLIVHDRSVPASSHTEPQRCGSSAGCSVSSALGVSVNGFETLVRRRPRNMPRAKGEQQAWREVVDRPGTGSVLTRAVSNYV
jgi:hypothetical protein